MNPFKDQELLVRAQTGADGFGELFDKYYDKIYTYAYRRVGARGTAEDIAACTFEDALRGIRRLRWDGKPIAAWLYRIASRRVADYYRGVKANPTLDIENIKLEGESSLAENVEQSETRSAVRATLARLELRDREIIQFVYFDELDTAEIAAIWNCSANSVYVRLHRALKRLRTLLEEDQNGME